MIETIELILDIKVRLRNIIGIKVHPAIGILFQIALFITAYKAQAVAIDMQVSRFCQTEMPASILHIIRGVPDDMAISMNVFSGVQKTLEIFLLCYSIAKATYHKGNKQLCNLGLFNFLKRLLELQTPRLNVYKLRLTIRRPHI